MDVKNRQRVMGRQVEHFVKRPKRHSGRSVEVVATITSTPSPGSMLRPDFQVGTAHVVVAGSADGPELEARTTKIH